MRSGKILEDTYKMEKVYNVITCPHCKELIGITEREINIIEKEEEIPLYAGDCCDCKFACFLTEKEKTYWTQSNKEKDSDIVAICAIQGNLNTIMFSKKDFEEKKNSCADGFRILVPTSDDPQGYRESYCYAFKRRDKKQVIK